MADKVIQIRSNLAVVQDHSRKFADFTFVYPVISRRARGLSIGINLNPDKICNFDCVYCEVDRRVPGKVSKVDLDQVRDELIGMIRFAKDGGLGKEPKFNEVPWLTRDIKDIAFSGDGEPTMIHNFHECVEAVVQVKEQESLATTKIRLITDAAGLDKADVKRGLELMDANSGEIWAKLDAGTEAFFQRVNRTTVRFDRILRNVAEAARVRPIVVQTLLVTIGGERMPEAELEAYCARLNEILQAGGKVKEVHLYTLARPAPEASVGKLTKIELEQVATAVRERTSLKVLTFE